MNDSAALIEIDGITKVYPGVRALDAVSFDVRPGEFHAICGENGAGKSTLMKVLSGVLTDYEGTLRVNGQPVRFQGTREAEAAGISIIHQELNLVNELSVAANVFLGRELTSRFGFLDEVAMHDEARMLLSSLECPIAPETDVRSLRVGDQQLVEIAKALSLRSRILIMDEPTSALTETEVERLFRIIDRLLADGVTILYISHKMDEVFRRSDRVTVLRDGCHVKTLTTSQTDPDEITRLMVGRAIEERSIEVARSTGDVVLQIDNLSLPWPGHVRPRLEELSLTLRSGEVLGIAGLMGAGRTELMECLFGCSDEEWTGEVRLNGVPIHPQHPADACDLGIALVTEDRKRLGLFHHFSVEENITICTLDELTDGPLLSSRKRADAAVNAVERLGIRTAGVENAITSLSGGNQQKCIIARWLRTKPDVLLLDDPTRGVDVGAKAELYRVIDELAGQGMAIIVTSSELPELITLCDRILVLCEGRLTGEFARDRFSEEEIIKAATGPEGHSI